MEAVNEKATTSSPRMNALLALALVRALWVLVSAWLREERAYKLAGELAEHIAVDDLGGVTRACLRYVSTNEAPSSVGSRRAALALMVVASVAKAWRDPRESPVDLLKIPTADVGEAATKGDEPVGYEPSKFWVDDVALDEAANDGATPDECDDAEGRS